MTDFALIGAGRLGTSLAYALSKKGYSVRALSCRRNSSVRESQRIIGEGKILTDNVKVAEEAKLLFICVPDEEIARVAEELASSTIDWKQRTVFHCSGLLSSQALSPLKEKEAIVGSFHPVQSFSQKKGDLKQFESVYIGLEGDRKAIELASRITRNLGGHPLTIRAEDKPLYHTACSLASNLFVALLDTSASLLTSIGLSEDDASRTLLPLVQRTLQNVKELDIKAALTGPIIRGDTHSVRKHLDALTKLPDAFNLYTSLAEQALRIAEKKNLPEKKIRALKKLLGGK